MTTQVAAVPCPTSASTAPSPCSRATSAAWSAGRRSRWRRFLPAFSSGTRRNSKSGTIPSSGLPAGGSSAIWSSSSNVRRQPSADCQKSASAAGFAVSMHRHWILRFMRRLCGPRGGPVHRFSAPARLLAGAPGPVISADGRGEQLEVPMGAVFAVDACRTPVGKIKGALAGVRPDHLAADVISAIVARSPWLDPESIDDVYWGAANQAGEDNRNVARMGVLLAGLPVTVPGATVNRLCGSGMEAIADAARAIAAGDADICLAGGSESMTRAPFVLPRSAEPFARESGVADTRLGWRLVSPLMKELYPPISLGETAENVADRYGVGRERQDGFALTSHQRAAAAAAAGRFDSELVPVAAPQGEVTADEGIKPGLTLAQLAARRPAFRPGGTVTGGNSAPLNDGAAALLIMSERAMTAAGAQPLARYVGTAAACVHPDYMGIGPVPAMTRVLARVGWQEI